MEPRERAIASAAVVALAVTLALRESEEPPTALGSLVAGGVAARGALHDSTILTESAVAARVEEPSIESRPSAPIVEEVISGRAVYSDGEPVSRLSVVATHVSLDDDEAGAPGLGAASAVTDENGRFSLVGLRSGSFRLECPDAAPGGESSSPVVAETGDLDASLVVERHRVRVRVLGANDDPVKGSLVTIAGWTSDHEAAFRTFVDSGAGPESAPPGSDLFSVQPGEAEIFAPPGAFLLIHGIDYRADVESDPRIARRTFEVPHDSNESLIALGLEPVVPGRLRLAIADSAGRPVIGGRAILRAVNRGAFAFTRREIPEDGCLGFVLPGEYRLQVAPGDPRCDASPYLSIEADVVVGAGEETVVSLVASEGGGIRLIFVGAPGLGDLRFIECELEVETAAGRSVLDVFGAHYCGGDVLGEAPDAPLTSNAWLVGTGLPPGEYRASARRQDCVPAESTVTVESGSVTDVVLELTPQRGD